MERTALAVKWYSLCIHICWAGPVVIGWLQKVDNGPDIVRPCGYWLVAESRHGPDIVRPCGYWLVPGFTFPYLSTVVWPNHS